MLPVGRVLSRKTKKRPERLTRVRWHQWSVVRLAAVAMITVVAGYLTAAILAVKNIDQLLHIVHDSTVEQSLRSGLDSVKDSYKTRQELVVERLTTRLNKTERPGQDQIAEILRETKIPEIMRAPEYKISRAPDTGKQDIAWIDRQNLAIKSYIVQFSEPALAEEYRKSEEVLKRYQVIGLELRERIRPALIKALSITLAIMCLLLVSAFAYMAIRGKSRIQALVHGFIQYAEVDDTFRFRHHWHNELGLLSKQFNNMADELDQNRARAIGLEKLASWQTIARKMAHEIKNPLTPIQIMIGQLKRHYEGKDEDYIQLLDKAHNVILEEVQSLRRMVDDFSQFAQLPSPRMAACNAVNCAKQTIALAESSYAPHVILYDGTNEMVPAEFDEQLIRLALHNLIKNAAEADPDHDTPITLRLRDNASHIIFEVEDRGPGIPDELKASIFEAYVTTKHTGPNPGMGLGLAICQKIILEHGGKMALESEPGRTIFRITLPRNRKGARL